MFIWTIGDAVGVFFLALAALFAILYFIAYVGDRVKSSIRGWLTRRKSPRA